MGRTPLLLDRRDAANRMATLLATADQAPQVRRLRTVSLSAAAVAATAAACPQALLRNRSCEIGLSAIAERVPQLRNLSGAFILGELQVFNKAQIVVKIGGLLGHIVGRFGAKSDG